MEKTAMLAALGAMTDSEARAIWMALSQYVENGDCSDDPGADPLLETARSAMEKLDAAMAETPCTKCGHICPTDKLCEKCGGDPMQPCDTLCVDCDADERDAPVSEVA